MTIVNLRILLVLQVVFPLYIVAGLLPGPFWFYESIRWVILFVCIYLAWLSIRRELVINFVLMLGVIFIFRPIYPFILDGIIWIAFNIATIVLILITIHYLKEEYKRMSDQKLPNLSNYIT